MKKLLIAGFISLFLFSCGETNKQNTADRQMKDDAGNSSVKANDAGGRYGVFTKNSSSMPINYIHAVWSDSENELVIYQTPSDITDDEKERLKNGETEFFVFSEKKSPDESRWQWYPFVVTELKFGPGEVNSANIESFYIMAFGIEQNNYTDNLNSFPSDKEKFEHVSFSNGELSINYFGESSIMESSYSWRVKK